MRSRLLVSTALTFLIVTGVFTAAAKSDGPPWVPWNRDVEYLFSHLFSVLGQNPVFQNLSPAERAEFEPVFRSHSLEAICATAFQILSAHHFELDAAEVGVDSRRNGLSRISTQDIRDALLQYQQRTAGHESVPISRIGSATPEILEVETAIQLVGPLLSRWRVDPTNARTCLFQCGGHVSALASLFISIGFEVTRVDAFPVDHIYLKHGNILIDSTAQQLIDHLSVRGILLTTETDLIEFASTHVGAIWGSHYAAFERSRAVGEADTWDLIRWHIPNYWAIGAEGSAHLPSRLSLFQSFTEEQRSRIQRARRVRDEIEVTRTVCHVLAERRDFLNAAEIAYRGHLPREVVRGYLADFERSQSVHQSPRFTIFSSDPGSQRVHSLLNLIFPLFERLSMQRRLPGSDQSEIARQRLRDNDTLRSILSYFELPTQFIPESGQDPEVIRVLTEDVVIDLYAGERFGNSQIRGTLISRPQDLENFRLREQLRLSSCRLKRIAHWALRNFRR